MMNVEGKFNIEVFFLASAHFPASAFFLKQKKKQKGYGI